MTRNSSHGDHKLVASRTYAYCPWCSAELVEAHVDGKTRKRCPECDFIHYRNPVPAAGAIIEKDNKILMVKRKYPPRIGDWTLPAGFMEWGESSAACCVREIAEETGLEVKLTSSYKVYSGKDDPRTRAVLILYIAEITGGKLRPGDDAGEVEYFSMAEMPENIAFESHRRALNEYMLMKKTGKLPDPNE
jgi:ADP-ribose pyrophosphatase YjhB (NUDIX family)